jgi:sugar (pentulose or hexulose) kinase
VLVQDYLIHRLTGLLAMARGSGTLTAALDIARPDRWARDVITGLGISEDIWLERVLPGATVAGAVHRQAAELMDEGAGIPVEEIRTCRGSARSDIWNQVFADVLNRSLVVPDTEEATAKGAASR